MADAPLTDKPAQPGVRMLLAGRVRSGGLTDAAASRQEGLTSSIITFVLQAVPQGEAVACGFAAFLPLVRM